MGGCQSTEEQVASEQAVASQKTSRLHSSKQTSELKSNLTAQTVDSNADFLNDYDVIRMLGVGSMGSVSLVKQRSGTMGLYAMKTIRLGRVNKGFLHELQQEINIVRNLDHPGIIKFYKVYYAKKQIYVLMEACSGGDLYKRKPYTEVQAASIVKQLLVAVAYMHSEGYVHRDIKFENIMFESPTSSNVKLIDFGLSSRYDPSRPLQKQVGTLQTMAPEVFSGTYGSQCDLWSVGVVAFELICGKKPFDAGNVISLMQQISNAKYHFNSKWDSKSSKAVTFCRSLLQKDVLARPTATEALKHGWFKVAATADARAGTGNRYHLDTDQREQILEYAESPILQKLVSLMVAHQTFPSEVQSLREQFDAYDTEGSGTISFKEFRAAFQSSSSNDEDIAKLFHGMDTYGDGRINYTEFLAATLTVDDYMTEDRITEVFEQLDEDDTGKISLENLKTAMGTTYGLLDNENESSVIEKLKEGDGITLEELLQMIRENKDELANKALMEHPRERYTL